jgi:hypothetical protein
MDDITDVGSFLNQAAIEFFSKERSRWIFRGQSNSNFDLTPSVSRLKHTSINREKYEASLFDIFKREARGLLTSTCNNDWEWLSLAQHHGLPTRFLDWSLNPLVALYFSVEKDPSDDGCLYALFAPKKAPSSIFENTPFSISQPVKYLPNTITPRIRAQEGLFVACSSLEEPLEKSLRSGWKIQKIFVRKESKERIRYELFRIGIHSSSLFPDIDGLAARLRWQHSVSPLTN